MVEKIENLDQILESIPIFKGLDKNELISLLEPVSELKEYSEGAVVFNEGDYGTHIYFLIEGVVDLLKNKESGDAEKIASVEAVNIFGEMALMALIDGSKRSATALASSYIRTLAISRTNFDRLIRKNAYLSITILRRIAAFISENVRKFNQISVDNIKKDDDEQINTSKPTRLFKTEVDPFEIIHLIPFFAGLDKERLDTVIKPMLELKEYGEGDIIFNEGDPGTHLYFLINGGVDILKKKETGESEKIFTLYPLSTFGEMSLIDNGQCSATAVAANSVKTLSMDKTSFERLIYENPDMAINILKCIARIIGNILRRSNTFYVNHIKEDY